MSITKTMKTTGMTCPSCAILIEMTLKKQPGVESVIADFARQSTEITYDPEAISDDDIVEKISGLGYTATKSVT